MTYYSVDEVESAIATLADTYPNTCQLIELPNRTIEGRVCHALNVGKGLDNASKPAALFTGAAHAREWGDQRYVFILLLIFLKHTNERLD
jgi:murein tripeptide amidase MpaA